MAEDRRGPVCPGCRAVDCRYEPGRYICGTYTVQRTGKLVESPTCLRRQIEQRTQERDEALAECAEQARLLGISGSKEARMQAKLDAYHTEREKIWAALSEKAEADLERIRQTNYGIRMTNYVCPACNGTGGVYKLPDDNG